MVSGLLCFLCFTSSVSLTSSYTEDEPHEVSWSSSWRISFWLIVLKRVGSLLRLHNFIHGSQSLKRLRFRVSSFLISVFLMMFFFNFGVLVLRMGIIFWGFCGFRRGILGLSSTRDCWCPYSTIGVRETGENRLLMTLSWRYFRPSVRRPSSVVRRPSSVVRPTIRRGGIKSFLERNPGTLTGDYTCLKGKE